MKKIAFVLHADFEQPGVIESWALEKDFEICTYRSFAEEDLPDVSEFDWLVIMGGPQSANRSDLFPYLKKEMELIKEAVADNKVVLGICLGAQLISEALGGQTEASPFKEIGSFPIEINDQGLHDPILRGFPTTLQVMHWHGDMIGLCEGAQVLASSAGCPRQMIRFNHKAYGLQCHLEPQKENIEAMIQNCSNELVLSSYIQSAKQLLASDFARMNHYMRLFLDNLYNYSS